MKAIKLFFKENRVEKAVFIFYIVLLMVAVYLHAPWFDEMQAWCIAKTAPLKDLLFVVPHYEGHPPFFHLLLAVFARTGVAWQIGLPFFSVICSIISAYLIIFKAPFARWIRCSLPFTFFLFYAYSVLSRPYSMLILCLLLAAVCFPQKDEKPVRFVGLLGLMCAFHLFGLALAGGIAAAWLWEIKGEQTWGSFFRSLLKNKRFYALAGLLGWAVVLLMIISPAQDAWVSSFTRTMPLWKRALYLLFVLPSDAVVTDIYSEVLALQMQFISTSVLLSGAIVGLCIWGMVFTVLPRKYWQYILFPILFIIGIMFFYCSRHHIGMWILVVLFGFWVAFSDKKEKPMVGVVAGKVCRFLFPLFLIVSLLWTGVSLYHNALYPAFPGEGIRTFLEEHNLVNSRIMGAWLAGKKSADGSINRPDQINVNSFGTEVAFHMGKNIIFNFNDGSAKIYRTHKYTSKSEEEEAFAKWREGGLPEVLFGRPFLDKVFGGEDLLKNYTATYTMNMYDVWKMFIPHHYVENIYVRNDLLKSHHLENYRRPSVPVDVE